MRQCFSRWLTAAVLLTCAIAPSQRVFAQAPPAPALPGIVDPHVTPAEQARMRTRALKFNKDQAAIVANPKLTPTQKQAKVLALLKVANADTLAMLTPAQRQQVAKNRAIVAKASAAQQARGKAFALTHKKDIDAGKALTAKLNASLTPPQKQQIAAIQTAARTQFQQMLSDSTLNQAQKQQKLGALQQDTQGKILAILTPAQKVDAQKLQQMENELRAEAQTAATK